MGKRTRPDSEGLPKRIQRRGERYYYVCTVHGKRKWMPISGPEDPQIAFFEMNDRSRGEDTKRIERWIDLRLTTIHAQAKNRSKKSGREFTLTKDELFELFARSKGKCEVTGMSLVFGTKNNKEEAPWIPSLDRKDASKGYTKDNCRIVCLAANSAMNNWGEAAMWEMLGRMNESKRREISTNIQT